MYEDGELGLHDVLEQDGVVRAGVVAYPVAAGRGHRKYEDTASDVLLRDLLRERGVADVGDVAVARMEGESDVRGVAVEGLAYVDPHPVDVEDVPRLERHASGREAPVVPRYAGPQPSGPLDDGRRAVQAPSLPPSSVGHPLYDAFRIGIVVGMAVGDHHRIGAGGIVVDPVHLRQRSGARVHVEELPVVLDEHPACAADLEHGRVPAAAGPQERDAE